jgi:hypothetical protein
MREQTRHRYPTSSDIVDWHEDPEGEGPAPAQEFVAQGEADEEDGPHVGAGAEHPARGEAALERRERELKVKD